MLLCHPGQGLGSPGPAGKRWEAYAVLADSETFASSPQTLGGAGQASEGKAAAGRAATPAADAQSHPLVDPGGARKVFYSLRLGGSLPAIDVRADRH